LLGFSDPEEAIEQYLVLSSDHTRRFSVVGVVENFRRQSMKHEIEPTFYYYSRHSVSNYYSIKLESENYKPTLSAINHTFSTLFPQTPVEYFFADQQFEDQYKTDQQFGKIFTLFSVMAILIACMGLYGLSHFMVQYRTKEIGVRKVLGASVGNIMLLLASDFVK